MTELVAPCTQLISTVLSPHAQQLGSSASPCEHITGLAPQQHINTSPIKARGPVGSELITFSCPPFSDCFAKPDQQGTRQSPHTCCNESRAHDQHMHTCNPTATFVNEAHLRIGLAGLQAGATTAATFSCSIGVPHIMGDPANGIEVHKLHKPRVSTVTGNEDEEEEFSGAYSGSCNSSRQYNQTGLSLSAPYCPKCTVFLRIGRPCDIRWSNMNWTAG